MKDKEHTSESLRTYIASGRDRDKLITLRSTQAGDREEEKGVEPHRGISPYGEKKEEQGKGDQREGEVVKET